ncbi:hypothetical protein ABT236_19620 [Streptomyces sp. NPDC001523]|uniref:hypothetical protein n=1 Tax=Streptomyces sp. NPDC001523 TaxID=3154383 RepID=UPI00332205E3
MRGRLGFAVPEERNRFLDSAEVDQVACESVAVGGGVGFKEGSSHFVRPVYSRIEARRLGLAAPAAVRAGRRTGPA